MKRIRYTLSIVLMSLVAMASAQSNVVTFGLRGGAYMLNPTTDYSLQTTMGPVGFFDFGYGFYGPAGKADLGFKLGLSVGYAQYEMSGNFINQYTNVDYEGASMLYTTSGLFTDRHEQLMGEVPLMLALRAKGFTMNIGGKLRVNLWQRSTMSISDPVIDAYYEEADIHVTNELITGVLADDQLIQTGTWGEPRLSAAVGAEIGYEWKMKSKGIIGIQAFVDYSVWNNYEPTDKPVIEVSPIVSASDPVPTVTLNNASQSLVSGMHPLTFGLKIYVGIDVLTKKGQERKANEEPLVINQRDTILQIDTFYLHRVDTVIMMDTMVYVDTLIQHKYVYQEDAVSRLQQSMRELNGLTNHYASGETALPKGERLDSCLNTIAELLTANPYLKIRVVGHTCNTGSHQTNQIVGQKRALALKQRLMEKNVPSSQIITDTMAETQPIKPNDTPQNREQNRRVEVEMEK